MSSSRRSRLFCQQPLRVGELIDIGQRNAHYLINVLRVKEGRELILFDGSGDDFSTRVESLSRKSLQLLVESVLPRECVAAESPLNTVLAIGVSKSEHMDFAIQKAVELGVTEIQPLLTERVSISHKASQLQKKHEHWQAIVISACEQSGRSVLPAVTEILSLREWLGENRLATPSEKMVRLMLQAGGPSFETLVKSSSSTPEKVKILIGPEGGFAPEECTMAEQAGFSLVGLGQRILRTETAPLAVLTLLQSAWGDF